MDMQQLLILLMLIPLVSSVVIWLCADNYKALSTLHIIASILTTIVGLIAVSNVINGTTYFLFNDMFFLDSLGAVFISLIAVTGLLVNLYSVKYMQWEVENKHLEVKDTKLFFSLFHLFVFTMTFSVLSNNIALMWVGIDATTLSSVFMVALHESSKSTET